MDYTCFVFHFVYIRVEPYIGSTGGGCKGALRGYPYSVTYIILIFLFNHFLLCNIENLLLIVLHTQRNTLWSCSVLSEDQRSYQPP